MSAPTWWPCRVSSAARLRVDLVVHRSGDIGSPRSSGSTRASSARRSPGSRSAACLRPPPGRRARPSGSRRNPAHRLPARPWPRGPRRPGPPPGSRHVPAPGPRRPSAAAAATHPDAAKITWNFAASTCRVSSIAPIPHQCSRSQEATGYFSASSCFKALPQAAVALRGPQDASPGPGCRDLMTDGASPCLPLVDEAITQSPRLARDF